MSFLRRLYFKCLPRNLAGMVLIFGNSMIALQLDLPGVLKFSAWFFPIALFVMLIILPIANFFLVFNVSKKLRDFQEGLLDTQERTMLLQQLMRKPLANMIMTMICLTGESCVYFFVFRDVIGKQLNICLLAFLYCILGSYFSAILTHSCTSRICTDYGNKIVESGVDKRYVSKKQKFGSPLFENMYIYMLFPLIFTCAMIVFVFVLGFLPQRPELWDPVEVQGGRTIFTLIQNLFIVAYPTVLFLKKYNKGNDDTMTIFETMYGSNLETEKMLDTDLSDEFSYSYFLINEMVLMFRKILERSAKIGEKISGSAQNLISVTTETETTALEQSTGVSEIVSTMDSAGKLAVEIAERINEVAALATETVQNVNTGLDMLHQNMENISQISELNDQTIEEIRDLNSKVVDVWEVVNLINSIADQTKIIAFNAELEATSVNSGGKNFRNVATEIRRLANNTVDSTEEIKKRITEMQNTVNSLNKLSMSNIGHINQGYNFIQSLEDSLAHINVSAETNVRTSNDIKQFVDQQASSFNQVTATIQQISTSLQNFSISTRTVIDTANDLKNHANNMEKIGTTNKEEGKENE